MGLQIALSIHQTSEDLEIDLKGLNNHLMIPSTTYSGDFAELYDEFTGDSNFVGPFKIDDDGLKIAQNWDGYFEGYDYSTMVWGCFHKGVAEDIAKFISKGKLVFQLETEGNDDEFYVCEPDTVTVKKLSNIEF